jgi:iron complex outermembrane recepter protein
MTRKNVLASAGVALLMISQLLMPLARAEEQAIETIVVTAQKRAQRLDDVGINVAAIAGDDVRVRHLDEFRDLSGTIPNLMVDENTPGLQPKVTIRGVGLNEFSSTNNPSAGIYQDEVFLASLSMMNFDFYDLERIEVLKGPQGTLYGRNATAGAINVISKQPSLTETTAWLSGGYGNYETATAEGVFNLPLGDTFAVRAALNGTRQGEGFWQSRLIDTDTGERAVYMGRLQALWEPRDDLSVTLKLEGIDEDGELGQGEFFGTADFTNPPTFACAALAAGRIDATCTDFFGYSDQDGDEDRGDWNNDSPLDTEQWTSLAKVVLDLDDAMSLTSITAYIDFDRTFNVDPDAGPRVQAEFDQSDLITQFSQEVRLSSSNPLLAWVVGGFFSWDEVDSRTPSYFDDLFLTRGLIASVQDTQSAAVFAEGEWTLTDTLSLVTGARYTWEEKSYRGGTSDTNPFGTSCLLSPTCTPGLTGVVPLSFLDDQINDKNGSWRFGLNWKPVEGGLLYASVSRGVKSGGYFNGLSTLTEALLPYDPEELTAYEVGWKIGASQHNLWLNTSLFYYDYQDQQAFQITDVGAVSFLKIDNIGESEVYGLDVDATWMPLPGLTLGASLGLLESELGEFVSAGPTGPVPVPKGNEMANAPETTFGTSARYERAITAGLVGMAQVDGRYADESYKDTQNTEYLVTDSYWIWNAQASVATADETWSVDLWCKNLTDERYLTSASDIGIGLGWRIYNQPRTYGITVRYGIPN